jgi:molybdenum cofactor guanylyltransferase
MPAAIPPEAITGLVLAGGQGSRMGGVDKGLQGHAGRPLAQHALDRLRPQVARLMVNANRHLAAYAAFGVPVVPDALSAYPGPLAGFLAGLEACETPWLLTVPCDAPLFPTDLVERLAHAAAQAEADMAMASAGPPEQARSQPVFCLLKTSLRDSLARYLAGGERQVERWARSQRHAVAHFDDAGAFTNVNTLAELAALQPPR